MKPFSKNNSSPCKECKKRQVGCHSTCQDYIQWIDENHQKAKEEKLEKETTIYEKRHIPKCKYYNEKKMQEVANYGKITTGGTTRWN